MIDPGELAALSRLLDAALALPDDAARAQWLAALGPEHAALRPRLQKLLAAHARPQAQLDAGAPLTALLDGAAVPGRFHAGQRVGPFSLVRELGRGGMSLVWLAERAAAPSERVALKLPAVSLDGAAFLARFERERELLQRLDHPGIVHLVEAGVDAGGQHYLALDYVDGRPLDEHCDAAGLDLNARLALFGQVLQAVQHAHERSVLHRDLKPSNILVTARGEVRLLDFGIAKLLVDGRADETELTALWGRALTRDYASPEQFSGDTVSARSDVYALGVVLFELLCGRRPFRAGAADRHPAEATLGPLEPPLPSRSCDAETVLARLEGGSQALARRLAGDIDAIVQRALQPEPAQRYASVGAMAADLARVLARRPVQSRAQRARVALAGLARRQRAGWTVALLLLALLLGQGRTHALASDLHRLLTAAPAGPRQAAIVSIGPEDHQRLFGGASPLDPARLQALVVRILAGRPAVLGVDIDTASPAFAALREGLAAPALARVVWGRDFEASDQAQALPVPRPVLGRADAAPPVRSALAVSVLDGGSGRVQWFRRSVSATPGPLPSLGARLAQDLQPAAGDPDVLRSIRFTRAARLDLPASVVLAEGFDWQGRIEGRVVLLGGRYDRADVHPTPLGLQHGVDVQAQVVETELAGQALPRPGAPALLAMLLLNLAATLWLFDRLGGARGLAAALVVGALLAAAGAATGAVPSWPHALAATLLVAAAHALARAAFSARWRVHRARPA